MSYIIIMVKLTLLKIKLIQRLLSAFTMLTIWQCHGSEFMVEQELALVTV